ncbi:MAG TPA: transglutaminase-like domain-containing protein, partial [Burkholderiales bacterium]|nr:transglutaminase-like domain-containing protein [Burkholderiales bacterium]
MFAAAQVTNPGAEYLAATEDVQLTPEITALATKLQRNPVLIYQWVRNHVDYVPTYGSVQGSARTLVTKQGNAYDTASLLIALLRASGIPARYVFGTVDVPIDRVMNWVGGVRAPQAALDLLSQGGVPVRGLAQGGVIRLARMEHVWVEAYVDFTPSRGAKNARPDAWVPMDASFKQYQFTAAMDVQQLQLPSSLPSVNTILQQVQFDPATGQLSGLTTPSAKSFQTEGEGKIREFFNQAEAASLAPVRESTIVSLTAPTLAATLPYSVVATSLPSAAIPA